jgi:S-adenosylmethionine decarboxylase proenzyme
MEFVGRHLFASLTEIEDVAFLSNADGIRDALLIGIEKAGATALGWKYHHFQPQGCTIVGILAESHVSVHTYPEHNALFLDAFTCGDICKPIYIFKELFTAIGPCKHVVETFMRSSAPSEKVDSHLSI